MDYLNLLSNDNVAEDGKEGEHRGKGAGAVHDEEGDMVDLEAIRKVSYACPALICVSDDYDFMAAVDELCGQLVDVAFDSPRLRKEEVADHGDVIRHGEDEGVTRSPMERSD